MDRRYKSPLSLGGAKAAPVEVGPLRAARSEAPTLASPEIREGSTPASQVRVAQDPRLGKTLVGRYRLDRPIGRGGMGRVYRATQLPLRRPVAVKILNREYQRKDPQFVRRFFLEAATAARLTHPNTITVFDYGEAETGELFIAMEYLRGRPLSRVLAAEGPFDTVRTLHVAAQICRALRAAHGKGIIHRDLKPGNIMLMDDGDDADLVKVLDFGLVKLFNSPDVEADADPMASEPIDEDLTRAGTFLGSPKYMSPEQIQGAALDPRTDIYSLGVLMYQMATGQTPFAGRTSVEIIYKHVNDPPPPLTAHGVDVPPELQAIILRCLAKHRDDRYASMRALLVHLKDAQRLLVPNTTDGDGEVDIDLGELTNSLLTRSAGPTAPELPFPGSDSGAAAQVHSPSPHDTGYESLVGNPPTPEAAAWPWVVAAALAAAAISGGIWVGALQRAWRTPPRAPPPAALAAPTAPDPSGAGARAGTSPKLNDRE